MGNNHPAKHKSAAGETTGRQGLAENKVTADYRKYAFKAHDDGGVGRGRRFLCDDLERICDTDGANTPVSDRQRGVYDRGEADSFSREPNYQAHGSAENILDYRELYGIHFPGK